MQMFPKEDYYDYGWIFPVLDEVHLATRRFDVEVKEPTLDPEVARLTFGLLCEMFQSIIGKCKVLPEDGVRTNLKSSAGPNYEFGQRKKKQVFEEYGEEFYFTWDYAHIYYFPMYWKMSGKEEMVKSKKLPKMVDGVFQPGDCRTFMFPDAPHGWCGQRMTQHTNDMIDGLRTTWSAIGFDRTHGGFTRLAQEMEKWYRKFTCDTLKWDARFGKTLFLFCILFRWVCLDPIYHTQDNWLRLVYQYENKVESLIFTPAGQLLWFQHGNKSGQDATSNDNTTGHIVICLTQSVITLLDMGDPVTLANVRKLWDFNLYGDDNLGGVSKRMYQWSKQNYGTFQGMMDNMYKRFSMVLKPEETVVQKTITGLTFIGGIFKATQYGWAHTFRMNRVMSAMGVDKSAMNYEQLWNKWTALLCLSAFEPERHKIRAWMQKQYEEKTEAVGARDLPDMYIPTDRDLWAFWFGWETVSAIKLDQNGLMEAVGAAPDKKILREEEMTLVDKILAPTRYGAYGGKGWTGGMWGGNHHNGGFDRNPVDHTDNNYKNHDSDIERDGGRTTRADRDLVKGLRESPEGPGTAHRNAAGLYFLAKDALRSVTGTHDPEYSIKRRATRTELASDMGSALKPQKHTGNALAKANGHNKSQYVKMGNPPKLPSRGTKEYIGKHVSILEKREKNRKKRMAKKANARKPKYPTGSGKRLTKRLSNVTIGNAMPIQDMMYPGDLWRSIKNGPAHSSGRYKGSDTLIFSGTDLVTVLPSSSSAQNFVTGQVVATITINPTRFPSSRLQQISDMWSCYKFLDLQFHMKGAAQGGTNLGGILLAFFDVDSSDSLLGIDPANAYKACAHSGKQEWNTYASKLIKMPVFRKDPYFMQPGQHDPLFVNQAVFYLIAETGFQIPAGSSLGSIDMAYRVEFYVPELTTSAAGMGVAGYDGFKVLNTTSYSNNLLGSSTLNVVTEPGNVGDVNVAYNPPQFAWPIPSQVTRVWLATISCVAGTSITTAPTWTTSGTGTFTYNPIGSLNSGAFCVGVYYITPLTPLTPTSGGVCFPSATYSGTISTTCWFTEIDAESSLLSAVKKHRNAINALMGLPKGLRLDQLNLEKADEILQEHIKQANIEFAAARAKEKEEAFEVAFLAAAEERRFHKKMVAKLQKQAVEIERGILPEESKESKQVKARLLRIDRENFALEREMRSRKRELKIKVLMAQGKEKCADDPDACYKDAASRYLLARNRQKATGAPITMDDVMGMKECVARDAHREDCGDFDYDYDRDHANYYVGHDAQQQNVLKNVRIADTEEDPEQNAGYYLSSDDDSDDVSQVEAHLIRLAKRKSLESNKTHSSAGKQPCPEGSKCGPD